MPKKKAPPKAAAKKTYRLTLDDKQLSVLVEALDLYSRMGIGQYERFLELCRPYTDERFKDKKVELICVQRLLDIIKELLLDLPSNANHGIFSDKVPDIYRIAWDVQKVIRHFRWQQRQDDGEERRYCVDADEPTPSVKDQPLAHIELAEDNS